MFPMGLSFWFPWFWIVIPTISVSSTSRNACSQRSFTLAGKFATGCIKHIVICFPHRWTACTLSYSCPLSEICDPYFFFSTKGTHLFTIDTPQQKNSLTSFVVRLLTVTTLWIQPHRCCCFLQATLFIVGGCWRHFLFYFKHPPRVHVLTARIPRNVSLILGVIIIFKYLCRSPIVALGVYTECFLLSSCFIQTRKR